MLNSHSIKKLPRSVLPGKVYWAVGLLGILLVPVFLNPVESGWQVCYFKLMTGYSCPGCGMSRSLYAFSHFRLQESFHFHMMGPIIYASLLLLLLKFSFEAVSGRDISLKPNSLILKIVIAAFVSLWFGFGIVRFINEL